MVAGNGDGDEQRGVTCEGGVVAVEGSGGTAADTHAIRGRDVRI
jgi:hypothetical protein